MTRPGGHRDAPQLARDHKGFLLGDPGRYGAGARNSKQGRNGPHLAAVIAGGSGNLLAIPCGGGGSVGGAMAGVIIAAAIGAALTGDMDCKRPKLGVQEPLARSALRALSRRTIATPPRGGG